MTPSSSIRRTPSPDTARPGRWEPATIPGPELGTDAARDPFNVFREFGARAKTEKAEPPRAIRNAERKALHELGLEVGADKAEIKAKFKMLVKRHHPDANNGDRATEDKLREIIQAYNYLKTTAARLK